MTLMDAYKNRVEALSRQVQILRASLDEINMALAAVGAFKDAEEGDEIMVPIGASSSVRMKVTSDRSVVVGIGSGVSVQKSAEEAIEYYEASSAEINEALKKSVELLNEAQQNLSAVNDAVQQEYAARRQAGAY